MANVIQCLLNRMIGISTELELMMKMGNTIKIRVVPYLITKNILRWMLVVWDLERMSLTAVMHNQLTGATVNQILQLPWPLAENKETAKILNNLKFKKTKICFRTTTIIRKLRTI